MTTNNVMGNSRFWRRIRGAVWGGAVCLLLLPLAAMQFTDEVKWTPFDFMAMGIMLGAVCGAFEVALRAARSHVYMIAAGVAAATGFLMTWINLAVGIIGNENNPDNQIFFGVLAISLIATALTRLKAAGMALAMGATAIAQAVTSVMTLSLGEYQGFVLTLVFVAMWLISAQLFREAVRQEALAGNLPQAGA